MTATVFIVHLFKKNYATGVSIMLKKIVKELEDVEKEAEKMIQDAQAEAEKMIQDEINWQIENRNKLILKINQNGQNLVKETIDNAQVKAEGIYKANIIEQQKIRQESLNKFEEAVQIILKQIVK